MFRMTPGAGIPVGGTIPSPSAAGWGGAAAALAVALLGYLATGPVDRRETLSETATAQRVAAVVAAAYRARVDFDRRDRTFLISYADSAVLDADQVAWAVCETIRSQPDMAGSAQLLRDWQVVALPAGSDPGSCRIGTLR